jgi:uncharacterized protein YegP (UPF0339 family)
MSKLSLLLAAVLSSSTLVACAAEEPTIETSNDWSELAGRPSFELWKGTDGNFRFHLMDETAEILVSSQGYVSRLGALNGLVSVLDNGAYRAQFAVETAVDGSTYFNLLAANKQVIGTSETHATVAETEAEIAATMKAVTDYVEAWEKGTGARYSLKLDAGGQWYFTLYARNGEAVLRSERYLDEAAALNGMFSVADNGAKLARYQVKQGASGKWYFVLTATNGQVIGTSETYASKYNAERGRDAVIALVPQVSLL